LLGVLASMSQIAWRCRSACTAKVCASCLACDARSDMTAAKMTTTTRTTIATRSTAQYFCHTVRRLSTAPPFQSSDLVLCGLSGVVRVEMGSAFLHQLGKQVVEHFGLLAGEFRVMVTRWSAGPADDLGGDLTDDEGEEASGGDDHRGGDRVVAGYCGGSGDEQCSYSVGHEHRAPPRLVRCDLSSVRLTVPVWLWVPRQEPHGHLSSVVVACQFGVAGGGQVTPMMSCVSGLVDPSHAVLIACDDPVPVMSP
jgi:hypothetical protein